MDTLKQVIDRASEMCGGQNELGRRLGLTPGSMSDIRAGRRSIPKEKVEALAKLTRIEPADLWLIAQDARNPFKASAPGVLSVVVSTVLAGVLSLAPFGESRAATGTYSGSDQTAKCTSWSL